MRFSEFQESEFPASDVLDAAQAVVYAAESEDGDPLDCLSPQARLVHQLLGLSAQINNGGFDQFFINCEGAYCEEMHDLLESIDAKDCARILKAAISQFPNGQVPKDDIERANLLLEITGKPEVAEAFSQLDQEFYKHDTALCERIESFVRGNPEATIEA